MPKLNFSKNDQEMGILNLCLPLLKQKELLSPIRLMHETFQLDFTQRDYQQTFIPLAEASKVFSPCENAKRPTGNPISSY